MITNEIIAIATIEDEYFLNWLFAEIAGAFGYNAWYECEEIWDDVCELLESFGCPTNLVDEMFSEMANEL